MLEVVNINNSSVGLRIDKWIKINLKKIPQSLIEKDLRNGKIKVNKKKVKSSYKLNIKDKIYLYNLNYKDFSISKKKLIPKDLVIKETEKDIVENNDNFLVINKKAGLPVQGGTKVKDNVVNILTNSIYFKDEKPFIVHRIDKDTSGLLIVAKNRKTAQQITSLFRIKKIYKTYLAISIGQIDKKKDIIDNSLIRYDGKKKILERATTNYELIDTNKIYSLFFKSWL